MNYKLAKKLEDAGFQKPNSNYVNGHIYYDYAQDGVYEVYGPSLDELIEAVGYRFTVLCRKNKDKWVAQYVDLTKLTNGNGNTPEEAVADLWIKQNQKVEIKVCQCEQAREILREYLEAGVIEKDFALQVRCPDCEKWIGQASEGYPLPADFSKMRGIHKIELKKP